VAVMMGSKVEVDTRSRGRLGSLRLLNFRDQCWNKLEIFLLVWRRQAGKGA